MTKDKNINRRAALKVIAIGVGTASTLPILKNGASGQHKHPDMQMGQSPDASVPGAAGGRFFNRQEIETIAAISDLIIPTDEHSPGAKAAGVSDFIDLIVNESSNETKALWRDGLAAVDRMSEQKFSAAFNQAGQGHQ